MKANASLSDVIEALKSGKTTSTAKLARRLTEKERKRVLMASLDVARPATIIELRLRGYVASDHPPNFDGITVGWHTQYRTVVALCGRNTKSPGRESRKIAILPRERGASFDKRSAAKAFCVRMDGNTGRCFVAILRR